MTKINKIIIISSIVLLLDQLSKLIIRITLNTNSFIRIIGDFFKITHVENKGAAWSIFNGRWFFLALISLLFLIFIISCIKKDNRNTKLNICAYSFLIGGIIGNMLDRIIYRTVTDFLDFKIFGYNFPIFNIADIFIVLGALFVIFEKDKK